MNICFISIGHISKLRGGIDRVTDIISKELIRRGHKIFLVSLWKAVQGDKIEDYQHFLPSQECSSKENCLFLKTFFKENEIEVIINQAETWSMLELINDSHGCIPIISCIHTDPLYNIKTIDDNIALWKYQNSKIEYLFKYPYFLARYIYQKYTRSKYLRRKYSKLYNTCNAVVLLSDSFKTPFMKITGISDSSKLYAISNPNSFDCVDIQENKENIVLVVSRLEFTPKRIDRILKIWKKIEQKHKDWELIILGEGSYRNFYENISSTLDLRQVTFTGTVSPLTYYQKASILCITSTHEGFSLAATEALQNEVIPIAFYSYEAIADIIEDNYNGYLIKPFSEKDYFKVLSSLIANKELRERIRNNIKIFNSKNKFATNYIVNNWESLITEICKKNEKKD